MAQVSCADSGGRYLSCQVKIICSPSYPVAAALGGWLEAPEPPTLVKVEFIRVLFIVSNKLCLYSCEPFQSS